jgi:hypothetical protein
MDAKKLAEIYQTAITKELGLVATIDGENDVIFKHPDLGTFFFSLDAEDDPEFMRLVFPNFMDDRLTGGDKDKLLALVNSVNMQNKAVKLYVRPDKADGTMNVSAAVEFFVAGQDQAPTQEHINSIIKRTVSAVKAGIENLLKQAKTSSDSF